MNTLLRRRLEMAARARDFLRAHRTEVASETMALARLEELLERAELLDAQQQTGLEATRLATVKRDELRRTLQNTLLGFLAAVATVAARQNTDLMLKFRIPRRGASNHAFLSAARGILVKATTQREVLVSQGLSASLFDDTAATLGEFEKTLEATRTGRRDHTGASSDLRRVAIEIREQVRLLDGLVRYRFGDNAELMGAWRSARNVLGPFKSRGEPDAGEGQPPEAGPDAVASAA